MSEEINPMDKFNFLLGAWKLEYQVPKSLFSEYDSGDGEGEFKRILNNKYVTFDYYAKLSKGEGAAHAIFFWDKRSNIYRYWWFEDSGEFMEATCNFLNETTLCLNWHNSLLVQTFQLIENGKMILQMRYPSNQNDYEVVLEVVFTKKK
jgi:L-rhamnose mutarotase